MAHRPGLDGGDHAQDGEGDERGHEEQRTPGKDRGETGAVHAGAGRPRGERTGGQAEDGHDDELGHDQRGQRLDESPAPVRHGRPDERGDGQGEEENGHVDGGGPDQQLEPQHERADREQ